MCGSLEVRGYCTNNNCDSQKICQHCGSKVVLRDSSVVYGKSYGFVWICSNFPNCYSYVGVHRNTTRPLGRVANNELRKLRIEAHKYFDHMWKLKQKRGCEENARELAYKWLADELCLPVEHCHIGYFDKYLTQKVINLCKKYYLIKR